MSKLTLLEAPVVPVPADQIIVVDELITEGYRDIPLHLVRISYTNRTRFNLEALQQLAENIAEVGILQPILMRPVTPTADAPQILEVVAGERRFRAAIMAGLHIAPGSIKILSDKQAAEIQLLENLQRENPHPLEEAIGFEQLMLKHGYNADQLAAKVKQSRSYVYGRLKLCALSLEARDMFLDNIERLPASTALLIARIPTPELQNKALGEIMTPSYNGDLMSVRAAAALIGNRYTLDLTEAPFDYKDTKLLAVAGNCVKCPKRTGNQPEIYPDAKSADVCTDPDCFAEKKAVHYHRILVIANKKGLAVLEGDDAREIVARTWSRDGEFVTDAQHLSTFERVTPDTGMAGTAAKHLAAEAMPAPAQYIKFGDGRVEPVYRRSDIQAALEKMGACESEAARSSRIAAEVTDPELAAAASQKQQADAARMKARQEEEDKAATITAERVAIYRKLRARAADGLSLAMLREMAKLMVTDYNDYSLPDDLIGDLYSFDRSDESVCAYIDHADASEVQRLMMDMIFGESLSISSHCLDDEPSRAEAAFLSLTKTEAITATAGEIAVERIDVGDLENPADVFDVISENIAHLEDVARHIIACAPHQLGNVEAAAKRLGYSYSVDGWNKTASPTAADNDEPIIAGADESAKKTERPKLQLKSKPAITTAPADGPVITIKKPKKDRTVALAPAEAWPFPTPSQPSEQSN